MRIAVAMSVVGLSVSMASAQTLTFEGFAPSGTLVNVNPGSPYIEGDFTIMPVNDESAVFDVSFPVTTMPGNPSSFLGWGEINSLTLSRSDSATFSLVSLLLGPSTIAQSPVTITLTAFFDGGGTATLVYSDLTTATPVSPNWNNLISVQFDTSDDAAIDNLLVPTPGAAALLGLGGLALGRRRR